MGVSFFFFTRRAYVVFVQWRQRNVLKDGCTCKGVVFIINFVPFLHILVAVAVVGSAHLS